jgi:hypothetical protein
MGQSKKFNSPHQVIGFIVVGGLLFDGVYSCVLDWRHRKAKKYGTIIHESTFDAIHQWTKRFLVLLAVIDGGM